MASSTRERYFSQLLSPHELPFLFSSFKKVLLLLNTANIVVTPLFDPMFF